METIKITTEDGNTLEGADLHLILHETKGWVALDDLKINDKVICGNKFEKIKNIEYVKVLQELYDVSTDSGDYLCTSNINKNSLNIDNFLDNSFLSHNTITAAITILHFSIFNQSRNTMIVANKADTVVEIVDKIKNIYKLLPFFLKPGLVNWNSKSIVFDNGCRIKTQARSKEPAIGFTIDFLYMDEFAHIPKNIINHYYKAAVPTVSSIKGSKIVITSTPNGANLFKDLVMGASLPDGHQDKNMYKLIKVLWYQVPDGKFEDGTTGTRLDAKIYPMDFEMKNQGYTINKLVDELSSYGFKCVKEVETTEAGDKEFIRVLHIKDVSEIDIIRNLKLVDGCGIGKFALITNWKEQETKLIGGEESFNQEYNLQFIAGSRRVLSANKAKELETRIVEYKPIDIEILEKRLTFTTEQLRFAPDYIEADKDKYYWLTTMDISEGLGQDDSVINGFRLMVRPREWFKENKIKSLYDAFYLKQTFVYNFNRLDHKTELPELYYLLHFDYLNPERTKTIVEYNGPGQAFISAMPGVFGSNNNFGSHIFIRYKHSIKDKIKKVGLKITRNKKSLVKDYISSIETDKLYVDEKETLEQMDNFIKIETPSGDWTYKADAGHDDIVMTEVSAATFFETQDFKNLCHLYYNELPSDIQNIIDGSINLDYNSQAISYKSVAHSRSSKSGIPNRTGRYSGGVAGRYSGGTGKYMRK